MGCWGGLPSRDPTPYTQAFTAISLAFALLVRSEFAVIAWLSSGSTAGSQNELPTNELPTNELPTNTVAIATEKMDK